LIPSLHNYFYLPRPGALPAYLKPIVEKLKKAKAEIDAGDKAGAGPISWSDLIFFAGKVATQAGWYQATVVTAELFL
jgi:hypothetical protein